MNKLQKAKDTINKWLYLNDDEWLDIIFACSLDRKIEGDPIWLLVIGVPSSSKTEILRTFKEGDDFYQLSMLTPNSFISGLTTDDGKGKNRMVQGLGEQVNGKTLILKDFTSILSTSKDKRDEIIGQLREFYDGSYSKKFGNFDKKITIHSRFGLLAGVTPKVDQYHSVMGELGERFLKLRSDFDDDEMLNKCDENEGKEVQMRKEMSNAVMDFVNNFKPRNVTISKEHRKEIKKAGQFIAKIRAPNTTRRLGNEVVEYQPPKEENSPRVYKQLLKLTKLLCCIYGLDEPNKMIIRRVWRVAYDSSPPDRLRVYKAILNEKNTLNLTETHTRARIPKTTTRDILNILREVGLVKGMYQDSDTNEYWINKTYTPLASSCDIVTETSHRYIPKVNKEELVTSE